MHNDSIQIFSIQLNSNLLYNISQKSYIADTKGLVSKHLNTLYATFTDLFQPVYIGDVIEYDLAFFTIKLIIKQLVIDFLDRLHH